MSDPKAYPDDSGPYDAAADAAAEPADDGKVFTADEGSDHGAPHDGEQDPLDQSDSLER
ncbi:MULTISPECIES: hypothetical protein [Microbacterium]|uniref:Uncharacterized protein n=1 Tax=Microbacterium galbinum TaxID=2851646 RepID=A0ABY4IQL5_9MICO|nr:hypothetical protein [Microbacterium galbinum]UPL13573.1 hypothetical protein KV396_03435 [Microbacterium galbinum]